MIQLRKWYLDCFDFLEKNNKKFFIIGSTLLNCVRGMGIRGDVMFDREVNIGMLASDITPEFIELLKNKYPYFNPLSDEYYKNTLLFYGPDGSKADPDHWQMRPGICLIAAFHKGKTKWLEYMGQTNFLTWPAYHLDEEWDTVELLGKKLKAPHDHKKWLAHYFGEDYMTEKKVWHWSSNSHNLEVLIDLKDRGEL
jgi:hypothetical protein